MRKEATPNTQGVYRFVGYQFMGLRNDMRSMDEVVLVETTISLRGVPELCVLRFGKSRKYPITQYQGTWYYIGDEIDRITSDESPAPA
jgi:hypothetical protein